MPYLIPQVLTDYFTSTDSRLEQLKSAIGKNNVSEVERLLKYEDVISVVEHRNGYNNEFIDKALEHSNLPALKSLISIQSGNSLNILIYATKKLVQQSNSAFLEEVTNLAEGSDKKNLLYRAIIESSIENEKYVFLQHLLHEGIEINLNYAIYLAAVLGKEEAIDLILEDKSRIKYIDYKTIKLVAENEVILTKLLTAAGTCEETQELVVRAFTDKIEEVIKCISTSTILSEIILQKLLINKDYENIEYLLERVEFDTDILAKFLSVAQEDADQRIISALSNSIGLNLGRYAQQGNHDAIKKILSMPDLIFSVDTVKKIMAKIGTCSSNVCFRTIIDSQFVKDNKIYLEFTFISAIRSNQVSHAAKLLKYDEIKNNKEILKKALLEAINYNNVVIINQFLKIPSISEDLLLLKKAFARAAEKGSIDIIDSILATLDLKEDDETNSKALCAAARNSQLQVIKKLLPANHIKDNVDLLQDIMTAAVETGDLDIVKEILKTKTVSTNQKLLLNAIKLAISKGNSTPHYYIARHLLKIGIIKDNHDHINEIFIYAKHNSANWIAHILLRHSDLPALCTSIEIAINKGESNINYLTSAIDRKLSSSQDPSLDEIKDDLLKLLSLAAKQKQTKNFMSLIKIYVQFDRRAAYDFMYNTIKENVNKELIKCFFVYFKKEHVVLDDWGMRLIKDLLPNNLQQPPKGDFDILSEVISLTPTAHNILEQELYSNEAESTQKPPESRGEEGVNGEKKPSFYNVKALISPSRFSKILKPLIKSSDADTLSGLLFKISQFHKRNTSTSEITFHPSFDTSNLMQAYLLNESREKAIIINLLLNEYSAIKRSDEECLNFLKVMHEAIEKSKETDLRRLKLLSAASHRLGNSNILNIFNADLNVNDATSSEDVNSLSLIDKGMYEYISRDGNHIIETQDYSYDKHSSRWILQDLKDLASMSDIDEISSQVIKSSADSFESMLEFVDSDISGLSSPLHDKYLKGEPIIIPTGCIGHSATIVALGDMLSITNKGLGKHPGNDKGTIIIKLSTPLSKDNIDSFIQSMNIDDQMLSVNCLISKLAGKEITSTELIKSPGDVLIDLPNEIGSIPQKPQKYATCGYTNKKSSVEALITMSKLIEMEHPYEKTYGLHVFNQHELSDYKSKFDRASRSARNNYKKITAKIRDLEISRLIEELKKESPKESESPSHALYVNNIINKLISHVNLHHHPKSDMVIENREILRAKDIINELELLGVSVKEKLTCKTKEALEINTPSPIIVPTSIVEYFSEAHNPAVSVAPQPAILEQNKSNWGKLVKHIKEKRKSYTAMVKERENQVAQASLHEQQRPKSPLEPKKD